LGHLFCGRYKSLIVDGSGRGYLKSVCDYVHLNPMRAKLLLADQPMKRFVWSSWPAYLPAPSQRPAWLRVDRLLGENGIPKDSPAGRQRLEPALEARRGAAEGEETFRQELLAHRSERIGAEHYGEERAQAAGARAERVVHVGLYLGDKPFIHSSEMVHISSLDPASPIRDENRIRTLLHARRILPEQ
jgi:hypothetical protein